MSGPLALYDSRGTIAQITLNRPDNRNSMDAQLLPAFGEIITRFKEEKTSVFDYHGQRKKLLRWGGF